ncbi:MAG: hypothetical protein ABSF25_04930 [Bryobacteraceae bacterium]|jgi:hypothetical protein
MSLEWLQTRITEEKDRREREARILERLPQALEEVHANLAACIEAYTEAFGPDAAQIRFEESRIVVTVREQRQGSWEETARVEIVIAPKLPGFQVEGAGEPLPVEVGILAGDKLFYKQREKFLSMEDIARRALDRVLFPKLGE